jgi:hypothetical protein
MKKREEAAQNIVVVVKSYVAPQERVEYKRGGAKASKA